MPTTRGNRNEIGTVSRRKFLRTSALVGGSGLVTAGSGFGKQPDSAPHDATLDVRAFGAVGDGHTLDTVAIQRALDTCHRHGGGVVRLPAGVWLAGTLHLRSRVTFDVTPGAVLLASPDDGDFAPHERLSFFSGSDTETTDFAHALLAGQDLERVAVVGGGVIDMNRRQRFGPKPIALKRCRFVRVAGVTIVHSPNYCVSLGGCHDVLVDGVTIRNAYSDGIDPDCCRRVRIANCDIEADDDALCLKASYLLGERGTTEEVVVTNCRLRSPSNCFKLGTESTGDFRQIALSNCVLSGLPPQGHEATRAVEGGGIAILSVDGGTIDGVTVSNIVMSAVPAPLFVRLGNRGRDQEHPTPGHVRNVSISGVVATGATGTGSIAGLPGHPVERITVENVRIAASGGGEVHGLDVPERDAVYPKVSMYGTLPAFGLYVRHARDVTLRNVDLGVDEPDARPALVADDVTRFHLAGLTGVTASGPGPVVWLNDVKSGLVHGNLAPEGGVFLRVTGEGTRSVALVGNAYWSPGPVEVAPEIAPEAVMQAAAAVDPTRRLQPG